MPRQWSAKPAAVAVVGLCGGLAAVLAYLAPDRPGQVLLTLAAAGLLGVAALGARLRPRLAADAAGLVVRGPRTAHRLAWSQVERVEVVRTRRLGRDVPVLEITPYDTPQRSGALLLLTRADLGADPREVLTALSALASR